MSETKTIIGDWNAARRVPLHQLGWKAFQDLCIGVAEECLRRPVQMFLPNNDAGRDGAFVGRWEAADPLAGESTIQCKFTSQPDKKLSVALLKDELDKARNLAARGLATDYIILTNHPVTGAAELQIKDAFRAVGVGTCRVFGADWIELQIRSSPRLRMLAPRLYGLGDLSDLIDARAYDQAKLILSSMGDDLQRLVITDAHRQSVRAISEHNLVLLLGAPAAGKSTIGASLAIGAADIWQCGTIRATSPEDIQRHLSPGSPQFFWIDDAWGNTQYQRQTAEAWNQVFPLMQGAIRTGTRFLITSRDYIWRGAQRDLKLQAIPVLNRSQVVINVEKLSTQEKAQILYNHLKLGDQPKAFKTAVKPFLPELAERKDFLPETARRLGATFFARRVSPTRDAVAEFFEEPEDFLLDTLRTLVPDCRAAVAVIFLHSGKVRSPVSADLLEPAAASFGATVADTRNQLEALNGSVLLLAQDEQGPYWTYKHPTVSDAFARYVAGSPELVEIYLKGAKVQSILSEVVTSGVNVWTFGDPVTVPDSLHDLLADRLEQAVERDLVSFLSYRANRAFMALMLQRRPSLILRLAIYSTPLKDDLDVSFAARLHEFGLLPEERRETLVEVIAEAAIDEADASFLDDEAIGAILTDDERDDILNQVAANVLNRIPDHVARVQRTWDSDYPPDAHFDTLEHSIKSFATALAGRHDVAPALQTLQREVSWAVSNLNDEYEPSSTTSAPTALSTPQAAPLTNLFRDVDE